MNARTARWIAWLLVAIYFLLAGTGLCLGALTDTSVGDFPIGLFVLLFTVIVVWPMIGARIVTHHPRHPVGWLLLGSFPLAAIDLFTIGFASYATLHSRGSPSIPGAVLVWLNWSAQPFVLVAFTLLNLLFPTGRLLSPRWRIVAWTCAGALPVYLTLQFLKPGSLALLPDLINPYAVSDSVWAALAPFHVFSVTLLVFCGLASVHSVFRRLRRSRGDERQQVKWLVVPAVLYWLSQPFGFLAEYEPSGVFLALGVILVLISVPLMVIAISVAIFRHRLYDIDLILNRTLVYGALTACVLAIYALSVGALGVLFQAQGNLVIALLATGLVAVLFQPLRERLQRTVNRLLYGERDNPLALMTSLTRQLEAARDPEAMLSDLVRMVAEALKLPFAAIAAGNVSQGNLLASWGKPGAEAAEFPLIYQAETVGCLLVAPRTPGERFDGAEQRLLKTIAGQVGALVQAARLTNDLKQSRMRIVSGREEERRRLRRDLHDGLGATLAALHLQTGVLKRMISQDAEAAEGVVSEFREELGVAIDDIRRVVYALRPPALDELGLVAAIRAQAARCAHPSTGDSAAATHELALHVRVDAPGELPPLPAAVEVAAYRIVQEALTNVLHHAQARECVVRLCLDDELQIEIVDDGAGIADRHHSGMGLVSMRERAAELGGVCVVERAPGGGTRVMARLPLPQE